jgi:beta-N-acetylhexosaminidase
MLPKLSQFIGQKLMLSFTGYEPSLEILDALRSQPVGGVTLYRAPNIHNPAQVHSLTAELQRIAFEWERTFAAGDGMLDPSDRAYAASADRHRPGGGQLMAIGEERPFPGNMALGASSLEDLARRAGRPPGESAAMGVNVNYAPVCDVLANPQNPVIGTRSFGEGPALVSRLAAAAVEGLQAAGVAACAKHFPGHGDTAVDPHFATPVLLHDEQRLRQVELPPFAGAIQAGVKMVMSAHLALPALNGGLELPATLSPAVLRGLLRQELGFEGLIASDAFDMKAIQQGPGLAIDAIAAFAAGIDLLLFGPATTGRQELFAGLLQAARRGLLRAGDLEASAGRVLALKRWLAGQERPSMAVVGCQEHLDLALEVARRSVTLVRDHNGLLPLRLPAEARLMAIVPQPVDLTPADTSSYVKPVLAEALQRCHPAVDEFIIPIQPSEAEIAALHTQAGNYDLVIAGTINAGEHPGQAALVEALLQSGVPTVVAALRLPMTRPVSARRHACTGVQPRYCRLCRGALRAGPIRGRFGHHPVGLMVPSSFPFSGSIRAPAIECERAAHIIAIRLLTTKEWTFAGLYARIRLLSKRRTSTHEGPKGYRIFLLCVLGGPFVLCVQE